MIQAAKPTLDSSNNNQKPHVCNIRSIDIATTFALLGSTSFGGMAAVGLIQNKIVHTKQWLSEKEFIESVALGQSLPGAVGPNIVTHIGFRLAGIAGAGIALLSYTLPSFFLIVALSVLYEKFQKIPAAERIFFGLNPAVAGLIIATAIFIGKSTLKTRLQMWQACLVYITVLFFPHLSIPILFGSALVGALLAYLKTNQNCPKIQTLFQAKWAILALFVSIAVIYVGNNSQIINLNYATLSWMKIHKLFSLAYVSLKLGTFTFGGGYVIVPLMEHDAVKTFGWVTHSEFANGIALGQLTPGPFVITVTFIGYRVAGIPGAIVATSGIFLPSFILMIWAARSLNRFHNNALIQGALSKIIPTITALLATAGTTLAKAAIVGTLTNKTIAIFLIISSASILIKYKINPLYILAISTVTGWVIITYV